ncbi:hypothetical protein EDB85DRAFT_1893296 [Lactarius pseudohatsudake]|nr:hypothetical protein EDB85DRAFT_1893296 [Lactarius pseudohatsudake]
MVSVAVAPPGFYGTIDVHMDPAFTKPGDIIVPNRGINFRYTEGLAILRSTDSAMVDLPKLIEPRHTIASIVSFSIKSSPLAQRDEPDAGLPELYNVPVCVSFVSLCPAEATQIDMIVGLVANGPNVSGGFCAGSHIVVDHQRINGTTFVFFRRGPGAPRGLRLGGDQHPAKHAICLWQPQENVPVIWACKDHFCRRKYLENIDQKDWRLQRRRLKTRTGRYSWDQPLCQSLIATVSLVEFPNLVLKQRKDGAAWKMAWKREEAAAVVGIWDMTGVSTVEEVAIWGGRSAYSSPVPLPRSEE